jgi:tRNA-specific 2-thiouridylase
MQKVVVGLSGGVDSSVAAYLLKEQGYDVICLYMINWHDTTGTLRGDCPWEEDLIFAELVAKKLDLPFHSVDLSEQYRERVVNYMFSEYEKGRTPNPDVLCNREIKFDLFIKEAEKLGADFIATGHYCIRDEVVVDGKTIYRLLAGKDPGKEQSYFLCQLSREQLKKALFPIGNLHKHEVRKLAVEKKLPTAEKKDSQGICFVGKVDLPTFLQQKLEKKEGEIIEIPENWEGYKTYDQAIKDNNIELFSKPHYYNKHDGKIMGTHKGAHFYTIGQRKGLNVGGTTEPLYVIATDVDKNIVYVGRGKEHRGLFRKALAVNNEEAHWIRRDLASHPGEEKVFSLRIRYRQPLQQGKLIHGDNNLYFSFDKKQRGIAAGQFIAWYNEDELLGSGVILE